MILSATVIHVPSEQPTIQAGLNAAAFGDTVLVAESIYTENLTWPSPDGICLTSESGPGNTIISGGGNGHVLTFSGSYTRLTVINGFTITGGKTNAGAGILVSSGSPAIIGNITENNTCQGGRDHGAGIYIAANSAPRIEGNLIRDNTCSDTATWNYGGGIFIDGDANPEICYNLITHNTCSRGYWNYGAGIYVDYGGRGVIYQNTIAENTNTQGDRGYGGGIYAASPAAPLIFCNLIAGNTCSSGIWNYGAGIHCATPARVVSNTIVGNALAGGSSRGGGIYLDSQVVVKNNVVAGNSATSGGGICNYRGPVTLRSNDVWNNTGGNYYNCSAGPGDISLDPLFTGGAHGAYYLSQIAAGQPGNSPCLDAGDTLLATSPLKLDSLLRAWTTRTDSAPDQIALDMGYHYPQGYFPVGVADRRNPPTARRASRPRSPLEVHPNPFTDAVHFHIPHSALRSSHFTLAIYDASGRRVGSLPVHCLPSAVCSATWDASRRAPGAYFYRLVADGETWTGRMVKTR
jgi:hypothetical protein